MLEIRKAVVGDARAVAEIYNYYIEETHHTFETELLSEEMAEARIIAVSKRYPFLVAESEGEVAGYAYAVRFKLREAYEHSVEVSVYVKNDAKQRGIGTSLYTQLFEELEDTHVHAILAGIALPNDSSIKFHEKLGFEKVAHFREVGYKLGRWIDVGYWEKMNY
ncbi:MAG: GNAT family N-acetyltransferase [Acidobacteriota bacterium]|nr:GNAT family N-acetyltransferase [Acidobacteriota bacterium]